MFQDIIALWRVGEPQALYAGNKNECRKKNPVRKPNRIREGHRRERLKYKPSSLS